MGKPIPLVTLHPGQHLVEGVLDGKQLQVKFCRTDRRLFCSAIRGRLRPCGCAIVCTPTVADLHARLPEKEKPDNTQNSSSHRAGLVRFRMDVTVRTRKVHGRWRPSAWSSR